MTTATLIPPPRELARRARLRYTSAEEGGLRRLPGGRTLVYLDPRGRVVRDRRQLARIRALGIPPAWTDVWICPDTRSHLQATGRDVRGRKQYIYHQDWQAHTSLTKFAKLRAFGEALPALRQQVAHDLRLTGLPRRKVVGAVVALLDGTLVRVGNEEYARSNGSYDLTTLRNRHAQIRGRVIHLRFKAKSGKLRELDFCDRRVARIVRQCQELPGQQLFQYSDEQDRLHRVESADVNRYLRKMTGQPFTAKDFRTWKASALVLEFFLKNAGPSLSLIDAKRVVTRALNEAAEALGNTVTICRKYYVHPQVVELFLAGQLSAACGSVPRAARQLSAQERLLLRLLRRLDRKRK
jgi:DNA topoisomerase I